MSAPKTPEPPQFADIRAAIAEAERFIAKARACLRAPTEYGSADRQANAAMKRASLDLTKALPRIR